MKDSGVEWLGEVPEGWEVKQFRRICHLKQGLQIAQNERFGEGGENRFEYITIKSINAGIDNINKEYIENPSKSVICYPDDILLARTGATGEVISNQFGVFHNNFFKVQYQKNKIIKNYLIYHLKVKLLKEHLLLLAGTTTIPDLNHGEFLSTHFCCPPITEQQKIAQFLDRETSKIDKLITKTRTSIDHLKEYRTALISAAVTGKIDVRDH
jgi:type I restriction enzyme S subunit